MAQLSIAEALRQAIREEMRRDPKVFCIGEDIGIPGGFGGESANDRRAGADGDAVEDPQGGVGFHQAGGLCSL